MKNKKRFYGYYWTINAKPFNLFKENVIDTDMVLNVTVKIYVHVNGESIDCK